MLPYPILPCHPVCWEAESHGHFWRAIPAEWTWDHCLLISLSVLIIWSSSKFCPSIAGLLVVFSVCSPQVGGAGNYQGKDRSMEFSLWMLSQCGLGRTDVDFSAMARSPPCHHTVLWGIILLWANQATRQFLSSELQGNYIILAAVYDWPGLSQCPCRVLGSRNGCAVT